MTTGSNQSELSNTLAAIFVTDADARAAVKELHKAGYKKTWLGVTRAGSGETMVDEPGSMARFFSPDDLPLHRALLKHGVSESQAMDVETNIAPGCAVLTVYIEDNPTRAMEILQAARGDVVSADTPDALNLASREPRTGVDKDERKAVDREIKDEARAGERSTARTADRTASTIRGDVGDASASQYDIEEEEFTLRRPTGGVR